MAKNWNLGHYCLNFCPLFLVYAYVYIVICFSFLCFSYAQDGSVGVDGLYNTFTISSFKYAQTVINPYDWRYIRVDLPPWFASVSIALESDVDLDPKTIRRPPKSTLPMICFREGSPPLPDVNNASLNGLVLGGIANGSSFGVVQNLQIVGLCYPMQKNISLRLTNEQISPGVWYIGLFNGIGPMRTQSKMINRGSGYSFSGNVSVEGCTASMMLGQFCNQTVDHLSCIDSYNLTESGFNYKSNNQVAENVITCRNADGKICNGDDGPKIYTLDMVGIAEKLILTATDVRFNETRFSDNSSNVSAIIMCYARHGAMPSNLSHDYSGNINEAELVIEAPRLGRWYITVEVVNLTDKTGGVPDRSRDLCYSLEWQVVQCPVDKAGLNCTWERYGLQTVLRKDPSGPFESYYLPISQKVSPVSANFPLEPLLSNVSSRRSDDAAWTFLVLDIPSGASGGNIHVRVASDAKINYEIYAKYGGLPTSNSWDYFYVNSTTNSNGSMFFKSYDSSEKTVSFYVLYVREGTWVIGLKHPSSFSETPTTMSISLERCPQKCSSHGSCHSVVDASGLTFYSYCHCDRTHGGFDCSVELVSHRGHMWQSVSLIASNAAAVLPAYWALRHKAFAEWVLFTSSGISSGLYHACDVGTWCALTFHVLQFMDFWLSFMAVVSTFVYLTTIDEISKRTIHTVVAILTALLAETGPTRSSNIVLVIAIGALGLLVGWLIELSTHLRSFSFPSVFCLDVLDRWHSLKGWIQNLIKMLIKRFRWAFMLAGFIALAMAAISWKLETSESYWIWHSAWHVSIYTSSFLFLCSKANAANCENGRPSETVYELTRQNSTGGEERVHI